MSVSEQIKKDYNNAAVTYSDYSLLPSAQLESQHVKLALGDCTDLTILDLGGDTGVHAREAIDLGALHVDIVDISPEMLKVGQKLEKSLGRMNIIRFFEADVSKPLSRLPLLESGYDVVMGNWIFSHAATVEVLEGIFRNITSYLKPGGCFVGARGVHNDLESPSLDIGKYGVTTKRMENIPGGVKFRCVLHCTPAIEFEVTSLKIMTSGSDEMYEKFGLTDVTVVPYESTEIVQRDPEFWQLFPDQPTYAVAKAVKKQGLA